MLDEADDRTTAVVEDTILRLVVGTGAAVTASAPSGAALSSIAEDTSEALDEPDDGATPTVAESSALFLDEPHIPMPGDTDVASVAEAAPEVLGTANDGDSVVAEKSAFLVDAAFIPSHGVTASADAAAIAEDAQGVVSDCGTIVAGDPERSFDGGH